MAKRERIIMTKPTQLNSRTSWGNPGLPPPETSGPPENNRKSRPEKFDRRTLKMLPAMVLSSR